MRLVVAEKPSVAKELAKALGCTRREKGFFAGGRDLVTYAVGHLVRLAGPDEMKPEWGKPWRREKLPMIPTAWPLVAEERTREQFDTVARLMLDRRVTAIVNATDAGREGEAIFRRIYALAGAEKPVQRFWTSSLTEEAIEAALARLRPAAEFDALGRAAEARAQLDWLIGMNHTRASTLHNGMLCSVGRVQTPTLAMVVRRHDEIAGFVKTYFYEVHAAVVGEHGEFVARALTKAGKFDFERKEDAEAIWRAVPEGTPAVATTVEVKPKRVPPPQLHNLGELQKEANRRFGLHADRTLEAAQALYEAKAITYPRSSSRYLSEDMVGGLGGVLRAIRLPGREEAVAAALVRAKGGPKLSKRFVDGSKLSDHHAIIPTAKGLPGGASEQQRKVYSILAERFVAMFLSDKETEETRIDLLAAGHRFRATGSRLVAAGWTVVGGGAEPRSEDGEERQALPEVRQGEVLQVLDAEVVTKERKPPPRYTDATLLAAMETAGKEIDDEELREAMRGKGLGTEATRAAILNRLLEQDYVFRDGKSLDATGKGIALIAQILPHLASPELTGEMEAKLSLVEQGRLDAGELLREVAEGLRKDVPAVFRSSAMKPVAAAAVGVKVEVGDGMRCPKCGAGVVTRREGQAFWGCSRFRDGCGFTVNTVVAGKTLSETQVRLLVTGKHRTKVIRGFKSKAGRSFDAALVLNPESGWKVEFEFER